MRPDRDRPPAPNPSEASFRRHGGCLQEAQTRWPEAPFPWLDLSTGISPNPYPAPPATAEARRRLPCPEALRRLEARASEAFGVARPEQVAATPGAEAALRLAPLLLGARSVAVAGPTYGGHAEAWTLSGARVEAVARREALDGGAGRAEVLVLVNPNNPDGELTPPGEVLALAARLAAQGQRLVVDESFVEVAPEASVAAQAGGGLLVLRSFGKFYGLAGLRLGFLIGDPSLALAARARLGDWPVSADALAAGLAAYGDPDWAARARLRLARGARRLDELLLRAGFTDLQGCPLFRYARAPDAPRRFERLASQGVLVRPFHHVPDRLRFGLPPTTAWARLETALMECAR
jgi:cobalamin biosynthesis protein CobC